MTASQILKEARPGDFVGEYKAPAGGGDTKVPVLDVFEGRLSNGALAQLGRGARVYEFMPLPGDELDVMGQPFATAAIGQARNLRGGHRGAHLTLVIPGDQSPHADTPDPVIEGRAQLSRLLEVMTRPDHLDRLYMGPEDSNLGPEELGALGFEAVRGGSDTMRLDLPVRAAA